MIGTRENYYLPDAYQHRVTVPHFDDTPYKDEWQDGIYREARDLATKERLWSVLDIGCGGGFKTLKWFGEYMWQTIGVEVEPTLSWLRRTYPHSHWKAWGELDLERPYNLVICSDVIEHVQRPDLLLENIASLNFRRLVISTPDPSLMGLGTEMGVPKNLHHLREWQMPAFRALLEDYFEVLDHRIVNKEQYTQMAICGPK